MTIGQFLRNVSLSNLLYIIQSKVRQWKEPLPVKNILDKVAACPECYIAGECRRCNCSFHDLIASDKVCETNENNYRHLLQNNKD